jgi:hypothetical protein
MTELAKDSVASEVIELLTRYSFDLGGYAVDRLVTYWLEHYPTNWLRLAVIEALYQGRYKAISVEQILNLWRRRGRTLYHFNHEFERIICGRFKSRLPPPAIKADASLPAIAPKPAPKPTPEPAITPHPVAEPELKAPEPIAKFEPPPAANDPTEPLTAPDSDLPGNLPPADAVAASPSSAPLPDRPEPAIAAETTHPEPTDLEPATEPNVASKDEPIPTFRPTVNSSTEPLKGGSYSNADAPRYPIGEFIPALEPSEFYSRLRAVVQNESSSFSFYTKLKAIAQGESTPGAHSTSRSEKKDDR